MAKPREELQSLLEKILGSRHVYFQPPESIRMSYPAVVYSLSNIRNSHADNHVYFQNNIYELTIIDYDPDSEIAKAVSKLSFCRFVRSYKADDLNHFVFELYY